MRRCRRRAAVRPTPTAARPIAVRPSNAGQGNEAARLAERPPQAQRRSPTTPHAGLVTHRLVPVVPRARNPGPRERRGVMQEPVAQAGWKAGQHEIELTERAHGELRLGALRQSYDCLRDGRRIVDRNGRSRHRAEFPSGVLVDRGVDGREVECGHLNVRARQLRPQRLGEAVEPALGRGVRAEIRRPAPGQDRRDVNDPAPALPPHLLERALSAADVPQQIDLQQLPELLDGDVLHRALNVDRGIVHPGVDRAVASHRGLDHRVQVVLAPHIARHGERVAAAGLDLAHQVVERLAAPGRKHDAGAASSEMHRSAASDAARCTGDDDGLLLQGSGSCPAGPVGSHG
jgi:hypothetical protein